MNEIETITNIYNKLEHIVDWSRKMSAIKVKENEGSAHYGIGDTMYRMCDKIKKLLEHEETAFLAEAVIENYWRIYYPTIVIPVDDILSGNNERIDEIKSLITDLEEYPAKKQWEEYSKAIKETAHKSGYDIKHPEFDNLAAISDIIYDALTVHSTYIGQKFTLCLSKGQQGKSAPILLNDIGIFSSESEAYRFYAEIPVDSFVAFYGIQKTYGQTDDEFEEWRGRNERKRNVMRNDSLSEEEYKNLPDPGSRRLGVIVRNGENIYTMFLPSNNGQYERSFEKKYNEYGIRMTYAPSQIFYKDPPPVSTNSTDLVPISKKHWKLSEILDEEQQIWLPIFYLKTKEKFFDETPDCKVAYLPEETEIVCSGEQGIIPVSVPTHYVSQIYTIPEPEELFGKKYDDLGETLYKHVPTADKNKYECAMKLCKEFGITSASIMDVPIRHNGFTDIDSANKQMNDRVAEAYFCVIGKRCKDAWELYSKDTIEWYKANIKAKFDEIRDKALRGEYTFAETRVHNRQIFNPDGTPKMEKQYSYSEKLIPVYEKTDISESKMTYYNSSEYKVWNPSTLIGKHPPVVVHIHPDTPEDIAMMLDCKVDELPFLLKYYGQTAQFRSYCERYLYHTACSLTTTIRLIYGKREYKAALENANKQNQ